MSTNNYLLVSVAVVEEVVTVGLIKNTSLPSRFETLVSYAVGFDEPLFTVIVPLPRFDAVSSDRVLEHAASNT